MCLHARECLTGNGAFVPIYSKKRKQSKDWHTELDFDAPVEPNSKLVYKSRFSVQKCSFEHKFLPRVPRVYTAVCLGNPADEFQNGKYSYLAHFLPLHLIVKWSVRQFIYY